MERYFSLYRSYCQPLGSTTPGITCYSGSHSFQWIAASLTDLNQEINVNLSSTNCDTGEATYNNLLVNKAFAKGGGNNLYSGGYVKDLSANGLTIMPVAYDCSTALDSEKIVLP